MVPPGARVAGDVIPGRRSFRPASGTAEILINSVLGGINLVDLMRPDLMYADALPGGAERGCHPSRGGHPAVVRHAGCRRRRSAGRSGRRRPQRPVPRVARVDRPLSRGRTPLKPCQRLRRQLRRSGHGLHPPATSRSRTSTACRRSALAEGGSPCPLSEPEPSNAVRAYSLHLRLPTR